MISTANDTATLVLTGRVALEEYTEAIYHFGELIKEIKKEVGVPKSDEWLLDELDLTSPESDQGRAVTRARGVCEEQVQVTRVESVIAQYEIVGKALRGEVSSSTIQARMWRSAQAIRSVINGHIRCITFETANVDLEVSSSAAAPAPAAKPSTAFGAIAGRVESMSRRGSLRFTLFERSSDQPVTCYLSVGQEDKMLDAWGKMVVVEGMVRRGSDGNPTSIRQITEVHPMTEHERWDYKRARGVLPWKHGDVLPEDLIRRVRNG